MGTGKPCAGQINATISCDFLIVLLRASLDDTVGVLVPTGSTFNTKKNIEIPVVQYLNAGTGNPWAGHIKVAIFDNSRLETLTLCSIGIVGVRVPTGSAIKS